MWTHKPNHTTNRKQLSSICGCQTPGTIAGSELLLTSQASMYRFYSAIYHVHLSLPTECVWIKSSLSRIDPGGRLNGWYHLLLSDTKLSLTLLSRAFLSGLRVGLRNCGARLKVSWDLTGRHFRREIQSAFTNNVFVWNWRWVPQG